MMDISASKGSSKFVFNHIVMPHPPYCFNSKGGQRDFSRLEGWNDKDLFNEQLLFLNREMLNLIKNIISNSDTQPIIVLQGDHGSASLLELSINEYSRHEALQERFSILNAILAPDDVKSHFYSSMTPVNTFRIILNETLQAKFETIEDNNFFIWYDNFSGFELMQNKEFS